MQRTWTARPAKERQAVIEILDRQRRRKALADLVPTLDAAIAVLTVAPKRRRRHHARELSEKWKRIRSMLDIPAQRPKAIREIAAAVREKKGLQGAASVLEVHHRTLFRLQEEHEDVREAIDRARPAG